MHAHAVQAGFGTVSALWDFAYDAGMGVGALGFGMPPARTGYSLAFVLTGGLMLTAPAPALRDRSATLKQMF